MLSLKRKTITRLKYVMHLLLALPVVWLVWQWYLAFMFLPHDLGFNPQETSNRFTGDWALRILILSLACTPMKMLLGKAWPLALRRQLGLWAFAYVVFHILSFVGLDKLWDWAELIEDIIKRPYIAVGMLAGIILFLLAVTSPKAVVRKMRTAHWKNLHKWVYVANILAGLHFLMMRRGFQVEPIIYLLIIGGLLAFRLPAIFSAVSRKPS